VNGQLAEVIPAQTDGVAPGVIVGGVTTVTVKGTPALVHVVVLFVTVSVPL
jgi:hypothetical protein